MLQIDDVFQGMLIADNGSQPSSRLWASGKIKSAWLLLKEGPFESLPHRRDQSLRVIALYKFRRCLAGYNLNRGNRQEYLLTDHLTQAVGSPANTHVGDFGKSVLLNFG